MANLTLGIAVLVAGLGLFALTASPGALSTHGTFAIHEVELGMTPSEVVRRFDAGPGGRWSEALGCDMPALEWSPADAAPPGSPLFARFEFHDGLLMAARIRVASGDPSARGERLVASTQVVLTRETQPDGSAAIVLLARGCPEHDAEVAQLLAGGPVRR